jgi:regulatory protein
MGDLDEEAYRKTLEDLAEKKYELLEMETEPVRKRKIMDYLLQKGFESELISSVIKQISAKGGK